MQNLRDETAAKPAEVTVDAFDCIHDYFFTKQFGKNIIDSRAQSSSFTAEKIQEIHNMGRPSKQRQIVLAARSLFVERGYQGTSIELVVQRAGVSKPTVYNHFPTKQAMLEEMFTELADWLASQIRQIEENYQREDPLAVISLYRAMASSPEMLAAFRIRVGERHKLEGEALTAFGALQSSIEQWLNTWFDDAVQARQANALAISQVLWPHMLGSDVPGGREILYLTTQR